MIPTAALLVILAGATLTMGQTKDHRFENLDVLRLLAMKPLTPSGQGPYNSWDRSPRIQEDLGIYPRFNPARDDDGETNYNDEILRGSTERSAVATVLHGRSRRQPAPALGATPTTGQPKLDHRFENLDLLRLLAKEPGLGPYKSWDRSPRIHEDLGIYPRFNPARDDDGETNYNEEILRGSTERSAVATELNGRRKRQPAFALGKAVTPYVGVGATPTSGQPKLDHRFENLDLLRLLAREPGLGPYKSWDRSPRIHEDLGIYPRFNPARDDDGETNYNEEILRGSTKRSAVATVLNGRRRRQPAPALGKAVTPYVGVGVLNDMGSFFDSLRDNLETLASLSPQQRSNLFVEPPTVVHASSSGGGSGGSGIRKFHALRPLRPTGNIRSYNRRSDVEAYGGYPGANHHDPGLLWTGLGR